VHFHREPRLAVLDNSGAGDDRPLYGGLGCIAACEWRSECASQSAAGGFVDRHSKRLIAGICLILGAIPIYLFLYATSFWQVLALGILITLPNTFINPSFQAMFADMVPREKRDA